MKTSSLKYPLKVGTRKFDAGTPCSILDAPSMTDWFPSIKRNDASNQVGIRFDDGTRTIVDRKQLVIK